MDNEELELEEEITEEETTTEEEASNEEKIHLNFEMDPVERLTKEIEFANSDYIKMVGNKLLEEFEKDSHLKEAYNTRKVTLQQVWDYIVSVAKSKQQNQYAVMSDDEVYGLAIHYVLDGEIKKTSDNYVLSKETKKSLEERAKQEFLAEQKKKLEDAEKKRIEKEKKAKEKAIEKEKKEREESGQLSLFDF